MAGWLADQLPRVLADDRFMRRFLGIFEPTADSVRDQIEALEYYIDVDTAPAEFVRWLGSWLGASADASWSLERQREVVRTVGREFPRRGTRAGLERVLTAITGAEALVVDGGGVWRAGNVMPSARHVTVRLASMGGLSEGQLHDLIEGELPTGVAFEVRLGERTMERPVSEARDIESMLEASAQP